MSREVCAPVAHRQFVFTIPKRLRIYFRSDRRLLGELCRAAWDVVGTVLQSVSGRPDTAAGMIGAIQSPRLREDLIHWHPHIHALVAEGVFMPDGKFLDLPKPASPAGAGFLKLWEQAVFDLLLAECNVIYKSGHNRMNRFPQPASENLPAEPKCGSEMKIISFFDRDQSEVIEKILKSCTCGTECACLPKPRRRQGSRNRLERRPSKRKSWKSAEKDSRRR